ncbi:MAG TPA: hypothetical protein DEP48_01050 [Persephonella sp.]|uniref:Uncharacterized protein n=1 Tax=Persephonella marina (strain DSM 14350 / EX-H1) TaxID=123214 RepID=C0QR79_PERMH|nr:conserved hypothetical protein [Persephonella marina EX-H1]HCB68922.1 hypothetical protein [Persephonella sp.]
MKGSVIKLLSGISVFLVSFPLIFFLTAFIQDITGISTGFSSIFTHILIFTVIYGFFQHIFKLNRKECIKYTVLSIITGYMVLLASCYYLFSNAPDYW